VPKFDCPYQIQKRVGQVAYALDIQNKGKLHDVCHVSCLKKKLGPIMPIHKELPFLGEEGKLILELEGILKVITKFLHSIDVNKYLVK
jgi:hypothetical protein